MKVFKKFIKYYKPYKFLFFTDMICALIVCLVDLSFPIILSYLSKNFFIKDRDTVLTGIIYIAVGLAIMYVAKYFCQYFIASWGHIMGARMETDMRQDLFYHLQMLPFSYYDENNTGEMMSKLVSDLFDISELAHHGPENVFISALKILGSFVILMMINVKMTFILFVVTLIMVIFSINRNTKMQKIFFDNRKKIANVNSSVQDSLEGIRVVNPLLMSLLNRKNLM